MTPFSLTFLLRQNPYLSNIISESMLAGIIIVADQLKLVLEAALGVKIYLGVRKVAQHLFLLLLLLTGARSFDLPQVL